MPNGGGVGNTLRILEVASICQALRKGGTDINKSLSALSIKQLDHRIVLGVIKARGLDVEKTLNFFKWAGLQKGFKHHAKTYTPMIWRLCREDKLEMVPSLLNDLKKDGCSVDTETSKLLFRSFIKSGMFDEALEILDRMEQHGGFSQINPQLYNYIIVALLKKSQVNKAFVIFNTMLKANINPYTTALNQLLLGLRKVYMMTEFEKVFWDARNMGCIFDKWTYSICIHAFGVVGKLGLAEEMFEEMKDRGCPPDVCIYNCLIAVRCKAGKLNEAMDIIEEMKGQGHDPDAISYGTLIRGLCKVNKISDALKLFSEMVHESCNPDLIVYNALLDGLFKVGKLDDACKLFETMVQQGMVPNCFSYNILIDGLFKKGRAEAAYMLFDDLKKKRQCVDGITYSIVISYLCKMGRIEDSLRLLEEMESRGLASDMVTITSLLIALHRSGRQDWARQLMKRIGDSSVVPNIIRWSADMEAVTKDRQEEGLDQRFMFVKNNNAFSGDPEKKKEQSNIWPPVGHVSHMKTSMGDSIVENHALKLVRAPTDIGKVSQGIEDVNNFTVSLSSSDMFANDTSTEEDPQKRNGCADTSKVSVDHTNGAGEQDTADRDFDFEAYPGFLALKGRRIQGRGMDSFNIDMFNTYMSVFSEQGKVKTAFRLFRNMIENGSEPETYTYNTLLTVFVKKGYFGEAWGLFLEMGRKSSFADVATYNIIIDSLGKNGEKDMSHAVLQAMLRKGGYLDIVMYNTLINTAGKAGELDEVEKLFRGMTANGLTPDVVTYNTLIEVYSKAGKVKKAYKILRMMIDAGCSPNHVTDTILDFLEQQIEKLRYQKASIRTDQIS
ncbi:pentatricopeptide repeat-containing protein At4g01570 isoform X1 [Cryptomeria japonica]|uniref:pentatricopeptide repeat-containing protein At4g01570 isoform X1 n=1 Tax=Cryptomeria japonica TaxID=3369 RepID=UPI0027DA8FC9|nr:pentatricopeptide repeat-containing protein At4g01570 isoform X1 [Cryptomeria japonica]XP_057860830.2 pentatricopeptide repeat-containing protein At4g01570 isoform X1 [Cryptomeria japonica]